MLRKLLILGSGIALAACSAIGIRDGTEEPSFTVMQRIGAVEIRAYGPRVAAETMVEADEEAARTVGFRRLAGYIFGGNQGKVGIAMTAPVAQAPGGQNLPREEQRSLTQTASGQWVVQFFLPREWTLESLPAPNDPLVRLVPVPASTVAVLRFTGDRGAAAVARRQTELLETIAPTDWHPAGQPMAWFYDPPWTLPWLRRNEVAVVVEMIPPKTR